MTKEDTQTTSDLIPATDDDSLELVPAGSADVTYSSSGESIGIGDISIPRLYLGQPSSHAVQDDLAPLGSIYVASDGDDPEPRIVYKPGGKTGALIHVLAMGRAWTYKDQEGHFRVTGDPEADRWPGSERAYQFLTMVPEIGLDIPATWLTKSSAMATGKRMLTAIKQVWPKPPWSLAWSLTTVQRQNKEGRWYVPQAVSVPTKREHVEAAEKLAELLAVAQ